MTLVGARARRPRARSGWSARPRLLVVAMVAAPAAAFLARPDGRRRRARVAAPDLRRAAALSRDGARHRRGDAPDASALARRRSRAAPRRRGLLGVAPHEPAVRVGARQAPGDPRAGRGVARGDRAARRRPLRLRAALPRRLGARSRRLLDDGRATRGRDARPPHARAQRPARSRCVGLRRERAEQPAGRLEIEQRVPTPTAAFESARVRAVPRRPHPRADGQRRALPLPRRPRDGRRPLARRSATSTSTWGRSSAPPGSSEATGRRGAPSRPTPDSRARPRRRRAPVAADPTLRRRRRIPAATAEAPTMPAEHERPRAAAAPLSSLGHRGAPTCDDRRRCWSSASEISCSTSSSGSSSRSPGARTRRRRSTLSTGGQAANVAAWVAALGGTARWLGKRGDDEAGRLGRVDADAPRGRAARPGRARRAPGVIVSLVEPDGERSMCPDRGASVDVRAGRARPVLARLRPPPRLRVRAARVAAAGDRDRGRARSRVPQAPDVSVDLSSWSGIRDAGPASFRETRPLARASTSSSRTSRSSRSSVARGTGPSGS